MILQSYESLRHAHNQPACLQCVYKMITRSTARRRRTSYILRSDCHESNKSTCMVDHTRRPRYSHDIVLRRRRRPSSSAKNIYNNCSHQSLLWSDSQVRFHDELDLLVFNVWIRPQHDLRQSPSVSRDLAADGHPASQLGRLILELIAFCMWLFILICVLYNLLM